MTSITIEPETINLGKITYTDKKKPMTVLFETSDPPDVYGYHLAKIIYEGKTKYQNILIADTSSYGRALVINGDIQSAELDESLYHEMLVHPAMLAHPNPQSVLVLGGGEGATVREILKHRSVKSVVMVDIDEELVDLCREHLSSWHRGSFDDPRVKLVFDDAVKFLKNDKNHYDVIILDLVDASNLEGKDPLYTRRFYTDVKKRLSPQGVIGVQATEFSFFENDSHGRLNRTIGKEFSEVHSYQVVVPSFLASWGYIIASDWFKPSQWTPEQIEKTMQKKLNPSALEHLHPEFLLKAFQLSKKAKAMLSKEGPIWE